MVRIVTLDFLPTPSPVPQMFQLKKVGFNSEDELQAARGFLFFFFLVVCGVGHCQLCLVQGEGQPLLSRKDVVPQLLDSFQSDTIFKAKE